VNVRYNIKTYYLNQELEELHIQNKQIKNNRKLEKTRLNKSKRSTGLYSTFNIIFQQEGQTIIKKTKMLL